MPEFATLVVFAAASLALTASPGPDMLLIASRSVGQDEGPGSHHWRHLSRDLLPCTSSGVRSFAAVRGGAHGI